MSEDLLRELKARQDIHDVLARYCRGADRCDGRLMAACFHDDAWDDHGFYDGPASDLLAASPKNLASLYTSTQHIMTNEYVEFEGNQARSETYILCLMRSVRDGLPVDVRFVCRYLDQFERRDGVWKIAHRTLVSDGTRIDPVTEQDERLNVVKQGARGEADPSHAFFRRSEELSSEQNDFNGGQ